MSLALGVLAALLVIVIGALIYRLSTGRSGSQLDDSSPMSAVSRRILVSYLLLFGVFLVYVLVSLYSIDFPEASLLPAETPAAAATSGHNSVLTAPTQNQ